MANYPLQQRAAQQFAGDRQLFNQLLARSKGAFANHLHEGINVEALSQRQIRPTLQFFVRPAILPQCLGSGILRRKVASLLAHRAACE
jgi:hypothetical protein